MKACRPSSVVTGITISDVRRTCEDRPSCARSGRPLTINIYEEKMGDFKRIA